MTPTSFVCGSIELGGEIITLTARNVRKYICEWHLDSFVKAIFLGKPLEAIKTIAEKMGLVGKIIDAEQIIKSIDQAVLKAIPPLKVFTTQCDVAVTDIVVNNISGSQRFGIGLLIHDNNRIGPVTIDGVAFLITLTPQHK